MRLLILTLGVTIFGMFYYYDKKAANYRQLCQSKGGEVIHGRDSMVCVDQKIFIKVNKD